MSTNKPRIYIVEDEALIAMELVDRLTKLGYDVCGKAARGEQALEEIPRANPDIVLMDICLAGELNGIQTAATLRQILDVPVIFLTAFSDSALLKEALGTEPFGYLLKPFEERELHATLQAALYRHRMERQRLHARKLESQLQIAGSIAHEFNNLLQIITGHLTLAQTALPSSSKDIAENLDRAMLAAQTAADITGTLLVYTGKSHVELGQANLNEIVQKYSAFPLLPHGSPSRLQLNLGNGILSVMVNKEQIAHLLDQLVANSAEAIGAGPGTIQLSTGVMDCDEATLSHSHLEGIARPGPFAYLEVTDNGCGMDAATLQRAFDLFFSTKFVGRGLGLPAVRGIVQSHRGGLLITSLPGQGTKVRILFPLQDRPYAATEPAPPQQAGEGRPDSADTILVVDDAVMIRALSQEALELSGYRVLTADSGAAALALFHEHHREIGCVLLDLSMPGMDGLQTFEALQEIKPGTKVLLISGYHPDTLRLQYGDKGFRGFLKKPFQLSVLRDEVERLLNSP